MSSSQRKGQVGPYELGPRYKHTGDLGRIYRARNAQTGAPALVIQPTARNPEDAPLADWQVRLSSSVSPAYLALEVESAPSKAVAEAAGEELEYMLDDMLSAIIFTAVREETIRHLRSPRARRKTESRWPRSIFGAALAAALAGVIIWSGHSGPPATTPLAARGGLEQARFDAGWAGSGELTGGALTGTADFEPFAITRPMPKKPFDVQKRPPCDKTLEEEHFGGCWVPHRTTAPCPDRLYELDGVCYLPAVKAAPPPASIFR